MGGRLSCCEKGHFDRAAPPHVGVGGEAGRGVAQVKLVAGRVVAGGVTAAHTVKSPVSAVVRVEKNEVGHHVHRAKSAKQLLEVAPVAHIEAAKIKRAGRRRAGAAHAAPRGGVCGDRAGQHLVRAACLHRVGVIVHVPLREEGHTNLVEAARCQRLQCLLLHLNVLTCPLVAGRANREVRRAVGVIQPESTRFDRPALCRRRRRHQQLTVHTLEGRLRAGGHVTPQTFGRWAEAHPELVAAIEETADRHCPSTVLVSEDG